MMGPKEKQLWEEYEAAKAAADEAQKKWHEAYVIGQAEREKARIDALVEERIKERDAAKPEARVHGA